MLEGAIFDVDGTLLSSMVIWYEVKAKFLKAVGREYRPELHKGVKHLSLYQAACFYKETYGIDELSVEEISDKINSMVGDFYRYEAQPKEGVRELLSEFSSRGVKMCIASATDRQLLEPALTRCGISDYFCDIFTCASVGHGKDEPHIYREALSRLSTAKEKTLVFEDAFAAARTAKNDGFPTAFVFDEYEPRQEEAKELSDFYIKDLNSLSELLDFADNL